MKLSETDFLPVSREDMRRRGWEDYDFLLVTGDAYVDHPSFGTPLIGRVLENAGYRHMYSFECNDPRYRADPAACDRRNVRWLEEHGVIE